MIAPPSTASLSHKTQSVNVGLLTTELLMAPPVSLDTFEVKLHLATAEEAYLADNAAYTSDTDDLSIRLSPNVVVTLQAGPTGWTAKTTHPATAKECALAIGGIAPLSPARGEGIVWCE